MFLENIGIYIDEENSILFDLETYDMFFVEDDFVLNFLKINKGKSYLSSEAKEYLNSRKKQIQNNKVTTIRLNVSHMCNFSCSYCYANNGTYGGSQLMSKKIAEDICTLIDSSFPDVNTLIFFGGEPTLNIPVIELFCNRYPYMKFFMQTNGYRLDDEKLICLIKKYNINITLSADGNKELHDRFRKTALGEPTYDRIVKNVSALYNRGIQIKTVEATFPQKTIYEIGKEKLAESIYDTFHCKYIIIHRILDFNTDNGKIDLAAKENYAPEWIFNQLIKKNNPFLLSDDALMAIVPFVCKHKYNKYFCNAGNSIISIDPNGNIWPCHFFINSDSSISSIYDYKENNRCKTLKTIHSNNKDSLKMCKNCIAKYHCHQCIKTGINNSDCEIIIHNTEHALKFLASNISSINIIAENLGDNQIEND